MKLVPHQKRPLLIDLPQKERYQLVNLQHIFFVFDGAESNSIFCIHKILRKSRATVHLHVVEICATLPFEIKFS